MLLYPITPVNTKINNHTFRGKNADIEKIFNSESVKDKISKIKTNKDAKNIFLGLSVLAGSVLAKLTSVADKNSEIEEFSNTILNHLGFKNESQLQKDMTELFASIISNKKTNNIVDITPLLKENPNRKRYLKILEHFPKLEKNYKKLLADVILEPNNTENKITLETIDVIFDIMSQQDKVKYYESFFDVLDTKYSSILPDVAANVLSAYRNGDTPMTYLYMLKSEKLSPEDVRKWANAKYLGSSEFYISKYLDESVLHNLSELKLKNNNFRITHMRPFDNYKHQIHTFRIATPDDLPLEKKLKTVADVHTALYGPISLNDKSDIVTNYMNIDIRTELIDNILKDRQLDSVYSFVKYINPKAFGDLKISSQDVKYLSRDSKIFKDIRSICSREVLNLNAENPRLCEIYALLQNEDIFKNLFTTIHAKLRFITRFVLRDKPNPQSLIFACKSKINTLEKELNQNFKKIYFMCYKNKKGSAPQFYNFNSKLGNHIKITLNSSGNIHTIYEDILQEQKCKG